MSDIEICITCGEQLYPGFIIQDSIVMICPNCDNDEEMEDEDNCSCHQDEINIFCRWCF
jgi:hypothetical protein